MALLCVAELDVQVLETRFANRAALLQRLLLRSNFGQLGVQRAAALLAGLGLLRQAQQLDVELVGARLRLAGLAAQRRQPAVGIVELVLDAAERSAPAVPSSAARSPGRGPAGRPARSRARRR
jgi:hypothetical protein